MLDRFSQPRKMRLDMRIQPPERLFLEATAVLSEPFAKFAIDLTLKS